LDGRNDHSRPTTGYSYAGRGRTDVTKETNGDQSELEKRQAYQEELRKQMEEQKQRKE
jgi:hypothetical protein